MQGSAQLQEENTALKTRIEDLEEENRELKALKKYYEDLFKLSQKKRFGTSSEQGKYNGVEEQLSLFNDVEAEYNGKRQFKDTSSRNPLACIGQVPCIAAS